MQHMSLWHLSLSGIFQLLLTRFWPNFKGRFLGSFWTNFIHHGEICPGKICPGDICPYLEYFSCYWPDFEKTFLTQFLEAVIWQNFLDTIFGGRDLFWSKNFWTQFCLTQSFLDLQIFLDTKFKKNWTQIFFRSQNFVNPNNSFGSKLFWTNIFWDLIFFLTQIVLDQIFLHPKFCLHLFWLEIYE